MPNRPTALTAIEARIVDDHVVIPSGITPVLMHSLGGCLIVYVKDWSAEREYDGNLFDLYPMSNLDHLILPVKHNGEPELQDWYQGFGRPTKIARKGLNGELTIRDRAEDE